MPITSESPVIVPATPEATYNVWWLVSLNVDSSDPSKTTASATFKLAKVVEGVVTFHVGANGEHTTRRLVIPDLFALAAEQPAIGTLVNSVIAAVGDIAKAQGVII